MWMVFIDISNFSDQVRENFTRIQNELLDLQRNITKLSNTSDMKELNDQLNATRQSLSDINVTVLRIEQTMPNAYNDTALKARIAALEKENTKLKSDLNAVNATKQKVIVREVNPTLTAFVIVLLIIGVISLLWGLTFWAKIMTEERPHSRSNTEDLKVIESSDYKVTDEDKAGKPKHIPKAKAKKLDDENNEDDEEELDDVMKKLEK